MSGCGGRKHTPITSRKQQKAFGYWKGHPKDRPAGLKVSDIESHLSESKSKNLPERALGNKNVRSK